MPYIYCSMEEMELMEKMLQPRTAMWWPRKTRPDSPEANLRARLLAELRYQRQRDPLAEIERARKQWGIRA